MQTKNTSSSRIIIFTLITSLLVVACSNAIAQVEIQYRSNVIDDTVMIKPVIEIVNTSGEVLSLDDLSLRYWYSDETAPAQQQLSMFYITNTANWQSPCYYPFNCITRTFNTIDDYSYVELGFTSASGTLIPGKRFHLQFGINANNWAMYDQSDDHSAIPTWNLVENSHITVYKNGVLVYGEEPIETEPEHPCFSEAPRYLSSSLQPAVIQYNATEPVQFSVRVPGPPTNVKMCSSRSDACPNQIILDGPDSQCNYTTTLSVEHITQSFNPQTDVNRAVFGFLQADSVGGWLNLIASISTDDLPHCTPVLLSNSAQQCEHVVNLVMPEIFSDTNQLTSAKRQQISNAFYQLYGDHYDFLNIVSVSQAYVQNRSFISTRNQNEGIGISLYDSTAAWGSNGQLQGNIVYPISHFFDGASVGHSHEIAHNWLNFSDLPVLAQTAPHWPLSSLANDILGFSTPNGQGLTFNFRLELVDGIVNAIPDNTPKSFSDLSLYAMGLLDPTEVGTHIVMDNASDISQFPNSNYSTFTIEDYIAANGVRLPAWTEAQKQFRVATILVSDALLDEISMSYFDYFAERMESTEETVIEKSGLSPPTPSKPFYSATGGRASLNAQID